MEREGKTLLVMSELYPSQQALDTAQEGMDEAMPETFRSWTNSWSRAPKYRVFRRVAINLNPIVQATVSTAVARPHIQRLTRLGHELSGGRLRVGCKLSPRRFGDARGWHSDHLLVRAARAWSGGVR